MQVIEKVKVVPEGYNGAGMDGYGCRDVNGKANAGLTLGIIGNNLQSMVQAEVLNLVRANIENSPEGKALLDNQLKLVKNLKTSIIEMSQREMQLFNAFKEASAKNPSLTYEEFIKTMK